MNSTLALDRYSRKFDEQKKRDSRKAQVKRSEVADEICKRYERWTGYGLSRKFPNWLDPYNAAIDAIKDLEYNPEDVREFCLSLKNYEDMENFADSGTFVSAVVEMSKGDNFEILLGNLYKYVHCLGYQNRKNLIIDQGAGQFIGRRMEAGSILINGNALDSVGNFMKGGKITIKGNVTNALGEKMEGGLITVEGNAGSAAGWEMSDGEIIIKGNAGDGIGERMQGGIIRVDGSIGETSNCRGGKIYHKGKLV